MVRSGKQEGRILCYNNPIAELCSGSTEDFESFSPGSNPGSAATVFLGSSMVERAAVNR